MAEALRRRRRALCRGKADDRPQRDHGAPLGYASAHGEPARRARLTRVCLECGVEGVRLTGGEPTVRADLPVLVRMLHDLQPGLDRRALAMWIRT